MHGRHVFITKPKHVTFRKTSTVPASIDIYSNICMGLTFQNIIANAPFHSGSSGLSDFQQAQNSTALLVTKQQNRRTKQDEHMARNKRFPKGCSTTRVCNSQGVCITRTYLQLFITTVMKPQNGILMLADTQRNAKHALRILVAKQS